jgi:hypothetical protein
MNGAISVPCKVMREVLSSALEAELAALFYNGKEGAPLRSQYLPSICAKGNGVDSSSFSLFLWGFALGWCVF